MTTTQGRQPSIPILEFDPIDEFEPTAITPKRLVVLPPKIPSERPNLSQLHTQLRTALRANNLLPAFTAASTTHIEFHYPISYELSKVRQIVKRVIGSKDPRHKITMTRRGDNQILKIRQMN